MNSIRPKKLSRYERILNFLAPKSDHTETLDLRRIYLNNFLKNHMYLQFEKKNV